jgi:hypothetical protein
MGKQTNKQTNKQTRRGRSPSVEEKLTKSNVPVSRTGTAECPHGALVLWSHGPNGDERERKKDGKRGLSTC